MTNETPDNSQPDSADLSHGQHDFGANLSSENAAAAAQPPSTPEAAASESVVPPAAEPVVPPVGEPLAAPAADGGVSGYPQAAPGYPVQSAPAHAASADYPQAAPYGQATGSQGGAHAYPGAGQVPGAKPSGAYPSGYPADAYPATPPAPKKPMSKGLLFGIIVGAVALVLLVAAIIVVPALLRAPAQTASDVVEEYLTAIADGDAEAALKFVDPYSDESLLTDEALAASLELAPITDIVVEESEDVERYDSTDVSVSFAIGGETIEREFEVYNYTDGDWVIYDGVISANFGSFEGLGLTVNGVEIDDTSVALFPGTYQLTLGFEEFVIDADTDTFRVAEDDDAEEFWDIQPVLTEDGEATFRALVRAAVEECVAMKTLSTPCGWDITDIDLNGYTPEDGTVTRTITSKGQKDLDGLETRIDYSSPTLVSTYDTVDVDMTLQGTKDGATAEFEVWFGGYMDRPSVDFAAETPTVTWD